MRKAVRSALLATLAWAGAAEACRCRPATPRSAYAQASAVLLGTVTEARDVGRYDRQYRVTVERSWKRRLSGAVAVNSVRSSCLAEFEPGRRYLIYAVTDPKGVLQTSNCQGNLPVANAAAALAYLRDRR